MAVSLEIEIKGKHRPADGAKGQSRSLASVAVLVLVGVIVVNLAVAGWLARFLLTTRLR